MSLKLKIQEDIKTALKQKEVEKLSILRLVMDTILKKEIEVKGEINDSEVLKLIMSAVKRAQDSIEQFKSGARQDLVDKEQKELDILRIYLPEQMTEQEIKGIVQKAIDSGADNMGTVMKQIMPQIQGKVDNRLVTDIVKELLA